MNLSVKNVPEPIVERLRQRARVNHRSLQGEVLSILELAAGPGLTVQEIRARNKALGFSTPSESTAIIRDDRDTRSLRG